MGWQGYVRGLLTRLDEDRHSAEDATPAAVDAAAHAAALVLARTRGQSRSVRVAVMHLNFARDHLGHVPPVPVPVRRASAELIGDATQLVDAARRALRGSRKLHSPVSLLARARAGVHLAAAHRALTAAQPVTRARDSVDPETLTGVG